ncbi:DUF4139 domain-containing protein [Pseudodesulfovibrio sp. zrk46]|uniref:DUF4139 domain-containing protein n=1 Tax=Pseudodesulfovibrio sp. zrk46 TaxID=2725288 RepID=UPI00144952B1|nr:DUF4139 domain-containing protein [Pseudodesulfovibrio sp. zrk46]QJB56688.1 DUF4139 domain-containing protein [Pseudodesulfovibrio sp. zrk46]
MNRLQSHIVISLLALTLLLCVPYSHAATVKGASVTVYNSGRALVKESRSVTLPQGMASVIFKDVPQSMDPTSVHASAKDMKVLGLQYSYSPITIKNLLDRYIGKELTVILPDPSNTEGRILKKAILVSNEGRPIFTVGNEVYVGNYDALLLPEMPGDLQTEPTLTLTTDNAHAGKRNVELRYLMSGLQWRADYTLSLDKTGETGAMDVWATINNSSGRAFSGSSVKLVAGDVKQEMGGRRMYKANAMVMEAAAAPMMDAAPPQEEEFAQFHVYSVPRSVSLPASGTRQVSLFSSSKVMLEQELVSTFQGYGGQHSGKMAQDVALSLKLNNTKKNGLGRPLPGGLVRVFMPTSDNSLLLAGESRIGHVGEGGEARLPLGNSFDVTVERTQTAYAKLGKTSYEASWRIEVKNGKDKPQILKLKERYSGQWKVVKADAKYVRTDAGGLEFTLTVPPSKDGSPTVVNYTIQVTR